MIVIMITYSQKQYNSKYTFEKYIVSLKNNKAYDACSSIASNSWSGPNLLFIHGNSGSGKTHLLIGLYNQYINNQPDRKILYIESYRFMHQYIESIRNRKQDTFLKLYNELDVLLFDDFDELVGKEETQVEICHIISELQNKGKMIVVAGIYHPKKYKNCYQKLFTRINSGRIIKIQ